MSLETLKAIPKTISFRMATLFAALFLVSSAIIFGLGFVMISSSLESKDHDLIYSKQDEYIAEYQQKGAAGLKADIDREADKVMARLATPDNQTLFLVMPADYYDDDYIKKLPNYKLSEIENLDFHQPWVVLRSLDGEDVLEIASIKLQDGNILFVGKSSEEREEVLERFKNVFTIVLIAAIGIGIIAGSLFTYRALRPVRQLIAFTRAIIDTGKMDARVPVPTTKDELQELIVLFNRMLERIDTLIRGMKDSLDNVAHDLRTPLTRLRSTAETAMKTGNLELSREAVADCLEESETVITMLNTLMDISEAETGVLNLRFETLNVTELIEDIVDFYRYVAEEKNITIEIEPSEQIHACVDRNRIHQVIANLLDNAIKYTPESGNIKVNVKLQDQDFVLTVSDSGIGIPQKELDRVWDRLYRCDKSRSQRGLGLGLSFVKAIVLAHHGSTSVSSELGKGSKFSVQFPVAQPNSGRNTLALQTTVS